jgi:hypothetical protein
LTARRVRRYGRIYGGRRALEFAADSREGALGTTSHVDVEPPFGAMHVAKKDGGDSRPDKRQNLAAEVLKIDRRREK